jgi:hypothetical protein
VFSKPQVEAQFKKFVTVRLYTDRVPAGVVQVPDADGARQFQKEKLQNIALPYYVVVRVQGKTLTRIGVYDKGVINTPQEFVDFLDVQ